MTEMTQKYLTERGREYAEARGFKPGPGPIDICDDEYQRLFVDFVQNGMYTRDFLPPGQRALVAVAALTALHNTDDEIERHIRSALTLTSLPEVREAILQAGVYAGFPSVMNGLRVLQSVATANEAE